MMGIRLDALDVEDDFARGRLLVLPRADLLDEPLRPGWLGASGGSVAFWTLR